MNIRNKVLRLIGVTAIMMGMSAGIVSAQQVDLDTDTDTTYVSVYCPQATEVTLSVPNAFSVDATSGTGGYSADLMAGFTIVANMTCNWTPGWFVGASITDFVYDGTAPAGTVQSFSSDHLDLLGGTLISYTGPTLVDPVAQAPYVWYGVFPGGWGGYDWDPLVMSTAMQFPYASPGVSTAQWNGHLTQLPANLAGGVYQADMTVVLYIP